MITRSAPKKSGSDEVEKLCVMVYDCADSDCWLTVPWPTFKSSVDFDSSSTFNSSTQRDAPNPMQAWPESSAAMPPEKDINLIIQ